MIVVYYKMYKIMAMHENFRFTIMAFPDLYEVFRRCCTKTNARRDDEREAPGAEPRPPEIEQPAAGDALAGGIPLEARARRNIERGDGLTVKEILKVGISFQFLRHARFPSYVHLHM
jgi:hypothetical protein